MPNAIVHVEIVGPRPAALRSFYAELFGWTFDMSAETAAEVSTPTDYGFTSSVNGAGIAGGVGGGEGFAPGVVVYVGVDDVGAALAKAIALGGAHVMGPVQNPGKGIVVAHFRDPQGSVLGLAGPV
ncbi:MAG TPA: VOC family protein [Myxococcota bacterium]